MKQKRLYRGRIVASAALFLAMSSSVLAEPVWTNTDDNIEFYEMDVDATGDALATLDYSTGIEWLDFSMTAGMSINQVLAETGAGGRFAGWRLPSYQEVTTLFNNWYDYSADGETVTSSAWASFSSDAPWTTTFGETFGYSAGPRTHALYKGVNDAPLLLGLGEFSYDTLYFNYAPSSVQTYDESDPYFGVALVSDGGTTLSSQSTPLLNINNPNAPVNNVSAPMVSGLFSLVLMALFRRRSTRA